MPLRGPYWDQCYLISPLMALMKGWSAPSAGLVTPSLGCSDIPEGLGHPEGPGQAREVARENLMRLNKTQCKVLHLGWGNPWDQSRLGMNRPRAALGRRTWGNWWVQQCVLGCIHSPGAAGRGNSAPLLHSGESPPAVLHPALGPLGQGHRTVAASPEEATNTI